MTLFNYEETPYVDPAEFEEAFRLYLDVWIGAIEAPDPTQIKTEIPMANGGTHRLQFEDNLLNRAALAIERHFQPDTRKGLSLFFRVFAFVETLEYLSKSEWTRNNSKGLWFHPAVFEVAAYCPMTEDGFFDLVVFQNLLEEFAEEFYPDYQYPSEVPDAVD